MADDSFAALHRHRGYAIAAALFAALLTGCATSVPDTCGGSMAVPQTKNLVPPDFYRHRREARKLLVFIHGITGDGTKTWTNVNGTYWPALVTADAGFDAFDVYVYAYPSAFTGNCTRIPDLAQELDTRLAQVVGRYEEVVFVAHSMGGLIVRQALLASDSRIAAKVSKLVFYGTPGGGSRLANRASLITSCTDDLRQLNLNSFLKQQVYDWQRLPPDAQIPTYCAAENDAKVVDTASAFTLCTTSPISMPWPHTELVRPGCQKDLRHVYLSDVISKPTRKAQAKTESGSDDHDDPRIKEYRDVLKDNEVRTFWMKADASGTEGTQAIVDLAGLPRAKRVTVFAAALQHREIAEKFAPRAQAVTRAVVGLDANLREELFRKIVVPASAATNPKIVEAVRAARLVLGFDDARQATLALADTPPPPRTPYQTPLTDDLRRWPAIGDAIERLLEAYREDDFEQALTQAIDEYNRLPPREQQELQAAYVDAFLRTQSWRSTYELHRERACVLAAKIGAKDRMARAIVDAYVIDDMPARGQHLVTESCLTNAQILEVARMSFERLFSRPDEPRFTPYYFGALRSAIAALPPKTVEPWVNHLIGAVKTSESNWQYKEGIAATLWVYFSRDDVPFRPDHWTLPFPFRTCSPELLDGIVKKVAAEDARAAWTTILSCRRSNPERDWSRIIEYADVLRPHIPESEHRQMFHEVVDGVRNTWTVELNTRQFWLLKKFAAERPDAELAQQKHLLLHWAGNVGNLGRPVMRQLAETFISRFDVLDDQDRRDLDDLVKTAPPMDPSRGALAGARAFFRVFDPRDRSEAINAFLAGKRVNRPRTPEELERDAIQFLEGRRSATDPNAAEVLAQVPPTKRALTAARELVRSYARMPVEEENLRVAILRLVSGPLLEALRKVVEGQQVTPSESASSLRLAMTLRCRRSSPEMAAASARQLQTLLTSADPRALYSSAAALEECGEPRLSADDLQRVSTAVSAHIADAPSLQALSLLVRAYQVLGFDAKEIVDRVWNRSRDLLYADPSAANGQLLPSILRALPAPDHSVAARMLQLTFLAYESEDAVLEKVSEMAGTKLASWWDAVAWISTAQSVQ